MVGIICAMAIEVDGLKALMQNTEETTYAGMTFTKGMIENTEVVAVECGIGKVNAAMCAQTMIDRFSPDVVRRGKSPLLRLSGLPHRAGSNNPTERCF